MASNPAELICACWKEFTIEQTNRIDAMTEIGVPARLTAGMFQAMVDTKNAITAMLARMDEAEKLLQEWKAAGILDEKIAASRGRKLLGVTVDRKDDN